MSWQNRGDDDEIWRILRKWPSPHLIHCIQPGPDLWMQLLTSTLSSFFVTASSIPPCYLVTWMKLYFPNWLDITTLHCSAHWTRTVQNRGMMWWLLDYWYCRSDVWALWWSVHHCTVSQCTPVAAVHTPHWQIPLQPSTTAGSTLIVLTSSPLSPLLSLLKFNSQTIQ